jgi:hypothetical protein
VDGSAERTTVVPAPAKYRHQGCSVCLSTAAYWHFRDGRLLDLVNDLDPISLRDAAPSASVRSRWSFVEFPRSSPCCAELIQERGQALVVKGWPQPPGLGERRQAM